MATQVAVVYPSASAFSGSSQLNIGPYFVPNVNRLLRAEVRGNVNFQGLILAPSSVQANFQLWALQWVPTGSAAADCITTADGENWLVREQLGRDDTTNAWTPDTDNCAFLATYTLNANWGGQLPIGYSIDIWLSLRAPTGAAIANQNLFASIRFWWL